MGLLNEILENINEQFVLLKRESSYLIVDKRRRTVVLIEDPLINVEKLIGLMIEAKVKIYNSPQELPEPSELPISISDVKNSLRVFIKKIYDNNSIETGAIITALLTHPIDSQEKKQIEKLMEDYAFNVLYPSEGLSLYSEIHNDTASITVIKNINNLPNQDMSWITKDIYNW